jgi:alpha-N-arabinofuranosidase
VIKILFITAISFLTHLLFAEESRLLAPVKENLSGSIVIDVSKIRAAVNPLIFGHNVEAGDSQFIFGDKPNDHRNGSGLWDFTNAKPAPEPVQFAKDIGMKMMRYPGGCLVHNYDWHKAVGPIETRPDFAFGIDEYVSWCRTVGAEPLFTVPVYVGTPSDKADLVEYCNATATPDHPWAMKRAAWGHPEPYHIRYWEVGNEEDHGNHDVKPFQKFTAKQYAELFLEYVKAMKKVDPSIQMSVLMGTGTPPSDPWNAAVMQIVKDKADFVVIHTYLPSSDKWMRSTDAAAEMLAEYRELIKKNSGKDIPMAITEFNVSSHPARFSYAGALFSADYVRWMLEPEHHILMANYWQYVYGYWGFVRPSAKGWLRMPAYFTFRLWGEHFGTQLLAQEIKAPKYQAKVQNQIDKIDFQIQAKNADDYSIQSTGDGSLTFQLKNIHKEYYLTFATADASPETLYTMSFEAKITGEPGPYILGIGLMDKRGWGATQSAIGLEGLEAANTWQTFSKDYQTLSDATGVAGVVRLRGKSEAGVNANVEVRNLKIVRKVIQPYDLLTASSSISADGKTVYLIVFNKSPINTIQTKIQLRGSATGEAKIWTVNAASLDATDEKAEVARETVSGAIVKKENDAFILSLPEHSMSALEFKIQ